MESNLSQQSTNPKAPRQHLQQQQRGIEGMVNRWIPGTYSPGTLPSRERPAVNLASTRGVPNRVPSGDDH